MAESRPLIVHVQQLLRLRGRAFVETAYQSVLGRPADAAGLTYYLSRVVSSQDKVQILFELASSEEGLKRTQTMPGLVELVNSKRVESTRFKQWLQIQKRADLSISRIEATLGSLSDEMDERMRALDDRLVQMARSFDAALLIAAKASTERPSEPLHATQPTREIQSIHRPDVMDGSFSARTGPDDLIKSLAEHVANTAQAQVLSKN